jgi:hypothetical protein
VNAGQHLSWGESVGIESIGPAKYFLHGGNNAGFKNYFWFAPAVGSGFLFLSNGDRGYAFVRPLVQLLLPGDHPALLAPELDLL